jgi:hypothetical protein
VEAKASDLIANVLKPKHVRPPQEDERFNCIADIGTKWYRNYFYFFSTYACPDPNALSVDECMKAIQDDSWFVP